MFNHLFDRRHFGKGLLASLAVPSALSACGRSDFGLAAAKGGRLNMLCWEGYNNPEILRPFRERYRGIEIKTQDGMSDYDLIAAVEGDPLGSWDLINVNQPWARRVLWPRGLIEPLDEERFRPYFDLMLPEFRDPLYSPAIGDGGEILGMPQRFGPFNYVINRDRISLAVAENEGWSLFARDGMVRNYAILDYDGWMIIDIALIAGLDPFVPFSGDDVDRFGREARRVYREAKFVTKDLEVANTALLKGEIDAYFSGGIFSIAALRFGGAGHIYAVTPRSGSLLGGRGGVDWVEVTSRVRGASSRAADFLSYVQEPEIVRRVALSGDTFNPVVQMGNSEVWGLFRRDELRAMQWDHLAEDRSYCASFGIIPSYDVLYPLVVFEAMRRRAHL